jgi:hypothetical protein
MGFQSRSALHPCSKHAASAAHILSGCVVAFNQGRFTWRHDNILRTILPDLKGIVNQANRRKQSLTIPKISASFVKANSKVSRAPPCPHKTSLLDGANDWILIVDLDKTFVWPIDEVLTDERPDVIIVSRSKKIIIWGELTSPSERRMKVSATIKTARYKKLKIALLVKRWSVHDFTFEAGSIGFLANTVRQFLKKIGFHGNHLKTLYQRISQTARRSSFYIWSARNSLTWLPPLLCKATMLPQSTVPPTPVPPSILALPPHGSTPAPSSASSPRSFEEEPLPNSPASQATFISRSPWNFF